MPRRPAKVTQADIARALRAAKEAGASEVVVDANGQIRISLVASASSIEAAESNDTGLPEWTPSDALKRHLKRTESG